MLQFLIKRKIINCLDEISDQAKEIGAVNTICFENQRKIGYNTDIFGFSKSLEINEINNIESVLILGSGGAAKTISYFCINNNIPFNIVSRKPSNSYISYKSLNEKHFIKKVLIVNCTPIGTFPDIDRCPDLPYNLINKENVIFDLVYNPSETLLMKKGKERGCKTINGHEMLRFQAEKSLELWAETFK
jgi:shikimate dehydrogenase